MQHIGSTPNYGHSDGGWNMSSTQVWPPDTHSMVTWSACPLVQPTWHWQPCPTSTRPTTTSSDGMHRFHSQRPTATWLSLLPADEPTYTMNSQEEAGPRHTLGTTHQGDMSLHRDQLSSESIHRQLQHQPHRPIHGFPKKTTGKKTHRQEPNENMPNNKKLEPRPKLHRQLLLMRLQNQTLVPLWHPPSSRHVNIGLTKLQSPEPLRPSARLPAPPSRAYLPVSQHLPQIQSPTRSTSSLHKQTSTPWHSHGTWSVVSLLHLLHQESQTAFWEHGSKDHRSNSPARCHPHICKACRHSCEKTAVSSWTVSSSPSLHPCFRTTIQSASAHGAQSYRATCLHSHQAINTLIASSWYPWHQKHKQQTPPCSSFGGTNISWSQGMLHKKDSPTVVQDLRSYQSDCHQPHETGSPSGTTVWTSSTRRSGLGLLGWDLTWYPPRHNDEGHEDGHRHRTHRRIGHRRWPPEQPFGLLSNPQLCWPSATAINELYTAFQWRRGRGMRAGPSHQSHQSTISEFTSIHVFLRHDHSTVRLTTSQFYPIHHDNFSVHILLARAAIPCSLWPTLCEPGCTEHRTLSLQITVDTQTMGSLIPLFRPDQVVAKTGSVLRDSIRNPNLVLFDEETHDACSSFDFTHWVMEPGSALRWYQVSPHDMLAEDTNDPQISVHFSNSSHHTFDIHSHIYPDCCRSLAPPVLLGSILLFRRHTQVQ